MGMRKGGQFFILAAVILAAVIVSLGLTTNYVRVNKEPENFYDFSYEVRKESGVVLDYQVYSDFEEGVSDDDLEDFVGLMAADIRDKDPEANFIFIYGDNTPVESGGGMKVRNYGREPVSDIPGGGEVFHNQISFIIGDNYVGTSVEATSDEYGDFWVQTIPLTENDDTLGLEIRGQEHIFPVSEHRQVIFVMQKDVEDETFIAVE